MPAMSLVRSTYGSQADAQKAADDLIGHRLAACAHVAPTASTYRWKGQVEHADEWRLEARVLVDDVDAVWERLLDRHPYDTPLVESAGDVQVPVRYLQWAKRVTRRP